MLSCLQNSNECTAMHTRAYWILCIYHVEAWESGFMQLVSPSPFSCIKHLHVNSFNETRQVKQLRLKTTPFFSREKVSCLRQDSIVHV